MSDLWSLPSRHACFIAVDRHISNTVREGLNMHAHSLLIDTNAFDFRLLLHHTLLQHHTAV